MPTVSAKKKQKRRKGQAGGLRGGKAFHVIEVIDTKAGVLIALEA